MGGNGGEAERETKMERKRGRGEREDGRAWEESKREAENMNI